METRISQIQSLSAVNSSQESVQYGRRVLIYFIGFFALIIVVNSVFIIKALSTHSGVVTENAYRKGLEYNQILKKAAFQKAEKIQGQIIYQNGVLNFQLKDQKDRNIENAKVSIYGRRTVTNAQDFKIQLNPISPGLYQKKFDFPGRGHWVLSLEAQWPTPSHYTYQIMEEIYIP
jgi:nitrogen fixation protein FixH